MGTVQTAASGTVPAVGAGGRGALLSIATLVLNATYEPLGIVPLRRAVVLVLASKAVVVAAGEGLLHSERQSLAVPSVVRLSRYVRVPYRRAVPLTRRSVLERDGHRCAYCAGKADSVDHVLPRSRGGEHVWTNVVAACGRCNHRKADRLLDELGWFLPFRPAAPAGGTAMLLGVARRHPGWAPYLGVASASA